ncbi:hypothetical protein SAMN05660653_01249 [Desulfonatronum thiosulfatophilum]|uniref:Uncharacterized protein n=1 Tax=Desulfonatronum thiosulfatophilum TaxID=617002 RepID=A0A1G6BZY1_9BACT|nr:hypothetical protein [Desulfonatronum thiosulfatophilum]SDB26180.1 hypothetical protein SAMN05660653_01249 [Desulfonatronum thiosulfatophilum]
MTSQSKEKKTPQRRQHPLILNFPFLHPEMESADLLEDLPEEVLFLDPGINENGSGRIWRPSNLPLSEELAKIFLRESASFALERGRSVGALKAAAMTGDDFYSQTVYSIQSKLTGGAEPRREDPAVRSQQTLLLAWQHEEQTLEIRNIQQGIDDGFAHLEQSLGVGDGEDLDELFGVRAAMAAPEQDQVVAWSGILEAVLFFLPESTALLSRHQDVTDALTDIASCSEEALTELQASDLLRSTARKTGARIIHAPGWKLMGKTRCPEHKPWLAQPRFMLLPASGNDLREDASS